MVTRQPVPDQSPHPGYEPRLWRNRPDREPGLVLDATLARESSVGERLQGPASVPECGGAHV